ncbi:MAG: hypothetical protein ABJC12_13370, partial [Saprospiraceae bacterium]
MRKIKALAIFNALSLIVHLLFVYLVMTKTINRLDVAEVSAKYESLFTPAGLTFSIWGIIYIIIGILCLYHIVIAYKHEKWHPANTELLQMNGFFIVLNLASAAWLVAWTQERLFLTIPLILLQLISLIIIHRRLGIYDPQKPLELKVATHFPMSIYFGWISIATIANVSSYLTAIGWDGWGLSAVQWTVIMISAAILLTLIMIFARKNIYFGLAVAWGLYGIIKKRETANADLYDPIITSAWAGIGIIFISSVIQVIRNLSRKKLPVIFPTT